jgi:hypothetical protein
MRIALAASASMLALTVSAQALNKYSWGFIKAGESEARLIDGVSESDVVALVGGRSFYIFGPRDRKRSGVR